MAFKNCFIVCVLMLGLVSFSSTNLNAIHAQQNEGFSLIANVQEDNSARIIPFQLARNLIVVQACVNGICGNFIVDTGAETLILNENYFSGEINDQYSAVDFSGSRTSIKESMVKFGWEVNKLSTEYAIIIDMTSIERIMGGKVLGNIGFEILKNYEILFDMHNRKITLTELDRKGKFKYGTRSQSVRDNSIDLHKNDHKPYLIAEIGGKKLKFGIDTGAGWSLIREGVLKQINSQFERQESIKSAGYNGEIHESQNGIIKDIKIEKTSWNPIKVIIGEKWDTAGSPRAKLDGLLGYEFMKQRIIGVNFIKGFVYFENDSSVVNAKGFVVADN